MNKPSWKIRRRIVWGSWSLGAVLVFGGIVAVFTDRLAAGELVAGGVALITLIASAYIGGAVAEDVQLHKKIGAENDG